MKFGRPKQGLTPEFEKAYKAWKAEQITATEAMKRLNMKPILSIVE